jgi:hypothetical protein
MKKQLQQVWGSLIGLMAVATIVILSLTKTMHPVDYLTGIGSNLPLNDDQAACVEKQALAGNPDSALQYALYLSQIKKDYAAARLWLLKAIELGSHSAKSIAKHYGIEVEKQKK